MKLEFELKDINGVDIHEGMRVCAYAQEHEEISRCHIGGALVIEVDGQRPKPLRDVPLFIGRVEWSPFWLSFRVIVERMLVDWDPAPASVQMGGGNYVYEVWDQERAEV